VLGDPKAPELLAALKDPKTVAAIVGTLPRRHPARVVLGNLKDRVALAALFSWAFDIAADQEPAESLYNSQSGVLAGLLKAARLPLDLSAPDKAINPEMFSVAYFRQFVADAGEEELLQARYDCRAIAVLAAAAEAVDWNAVSRALDHDTAFVALTSSEPPSYRARRAERHARRRNQLQPAVVRLGLALWKSFDFRGILIPALVYLQGSPEHRKIFTEIIALSHCALALFPRRTPQSNA
jgi:hypothetical protein